jgi:hypothetical protein
MKPAGFIAATLAICEDMGEPAPMQWLVARREGRVVAALLYGAGPATASYILPCAVDEERPHQVNALLIATALEHARRRGLRSWNFESSPLWDDAVHRYKAGWGAKPVPYAITSFYRGGRSPAQNEVKAIRDLHPHYFVAPLKGMGGLWPANVPLAEEHVALSRFLRR